MTEERVKISFKEPSVQTWNYNGVEFQFTPFITPEQQVALIERHLEQLFQGGNFYTSQAYVEAEYDLRNSILYLLTNVEIEGKSPVMDEKFWNNFSYEIENYHYFMRRLHSVLDDYQSRQLSLSTAVEKATDKIVEMLSFFENLDPEKLEELQKTGIEMIQQLNNTKFGSEAVLQQAIDESNK